MVTQKGRYRYYGKSTDVKPTITDIPNGAVFIEVDTGKAFLFEAEGKVWYEIPEGASSLPYALGEDF